ncbi:hypothetical protein R1flu_012633 [Riccia fluitans]|uniref:SMP domain-containing protein n=1 Tax=Riccia fluitans TaxID=41844 RepID=A0ABD1ZBH6_9MARC
MSSTQQMRPGATGGVHVTMEDVTAAEPYPGCAPVTTAEARPTRQFTTMSTVPGITATQTVTTGAAATPVTIAAALETAGAREAHKPLTESDARAIQSAEARATGTPGGVKGGPAAMAQSVIDTPGMRGADVTLGDVLSDATLQLPRDKVMTPEDASRVQSAEARHTPTGEIPKGGMAATMQEAAAHNQSTAFVSAGMPGAAV